jgi:hypothetical protein
LVEDFKDWVTVGQVERAWGSGHRWWVKAARALEEAAVASHRKRQQGGQRERDGGLLGQAEEEAEAVRRAQKREMALRRTRGPPVIQVRRANHFRNHV